MTTVAMVSSMDRAPDVERLFSWLKAPMVPYREFAPQIELAEAVAAWPIVHKAAVQTGVSAEAEPGPRGDSAAHARIARERMTMPPAAARAIRESPLVGTAGAPIPGRLPERPSGLGLVAARGARLRAGPPEVQAQPAEARAQPAEARPQPVEAKVEPVEAPAEPTEARAEPAARAAAEPPPAPTAARAPDERAPGARPAQAAPAARPAPGGAEHAAPYTQRLSGGRGTLLGGEYRGHGREAPPATRAAGREGRSLDAVFARLASARDGLPDPRARARTLPGLSMVFNRLR